MIPSFSPLLKGLATTFMFLLIWFPNYGQKPQDRQIAKQFTSQRYLYGTCVDNVCKSDKLGYKFDYWEYTPSDYVINNTKNFPLVIFLHGMGDKANGTPTSLNLLLASGMPKLINANKADYPFITISPQTRWPVDWQPEMVDEMIEIAKKTLRVDTNRIYVTGLSMGGDGTYRYAGNNNYYKKLAAIVPVSAYMSGTDACQVAKIPVRAFTGKDDWMLTSSINAVNGVNNCNPKPEPLAELKLTIGGHDGIAWDTIYSMYNKDIWDWMLSKTRKDLITSSEENKTLINNVGINPNPISESVTISFNNIESKELKVVLINTLGIEDIILPFSQFPIGTNEIKINLINKDSGLYIIKIISKNDILFSRKISKIE